MSLSRYGEPGEWFDVTPGYVYVRDGEFVDYEFNVGIQSVPHFCEITMRALEQSGELDDDTLADCEAALRKRFDYAFDEGEDEQ